jgi:two-component system, LuxR family, response regulator FixJ
MFADAVVYIVDDDRAARDAVAALVGEMGVTAKKYASAEDFLQAYDGHRPGCLVTDVRMLGMSGIELQDQLARRGVSLSVIVLTAYADTPTTIRAIKQGAVTLLEKPCRDQELWDAINAALREDVTKCQRDQRLAGIRRRLDALTPAERRVLERMVQGDSNKIMAKRLGVSVRTIEVRRASVFRKMQCESLAELVRMCLEGCPPP